MMNRLLNFAFKFKMRRYTVAWDQLMLMLFAPQILFTVRPVFVFSPSHILSLMIKVLQYTPHLDP